MKLSIKDRLLFASLYPQKGNLVEQILTKDINEKVSLKQKEVVDIGLKEKEGQITWSDKKDVVKEVDFTDAELDFLKSQVERLDEAKEITREITDLCIKIKG